LEQAKGYAEALEKSTFPLSTMKEVFEEKKKVSATID
jgi:hypothetical protein